MSKADRYKELVEEYSEEEPYKEKSDEEYSEAEPIQELGEEEFKNEMENFLNPEFDLAALTNTASLINTEVIEPLIAEMLVNIANNQRIFNSEH